MNLIKQIRDINISTKLKWLLGIAGCTLLIILITVLFSIKMLSSVRATVAAQGVWEKYQKKLHTNALIYSQNFNMVSYNAFQDNLEMIHTFEDIRNEILKGVPDENYASNLLIKTGVNKKDIPGMIFLFKHFRKISFIDSALDFWGQTKPLFDYQQQLISNIKNNESRDAANKDFFEEINAVNQEITVLGSKFNQTINEGARWLESFVYNTILFIILSIGILIISTLNLLTQQISKWLYKLNKATKAITSGNLSYKIETGEGHELAKLSDQFNLMSDSILSLISKNKTIEDNLRDLSLVASETDNAIFICDASGKIEWVNQSVINISGFSFAEIVGTHGECLLPEGVVSGLNPNSEYFKEILASKKSVKYETHNLTKAGGTYWVLTTLSPVLSQENEVIKIIAIDIDITRIKQTQKELREAKNRAEESEQAKHTFLANMSHEIRTPMNAIIGFTDLLENSDLSPSQKEGVEAIKSSGENLLVLINDILDLAKIEAKKLRLECINFNVHDIFKSAIHLFKPKAESKNLLLHLDIEDSVPTTLKGDPYRINQILTNLLSNAIKFTEKGSIHVSVAISETIQGNITLVFAVKDSGIGIPKDKLSNVFNSFTQASEGDTRKYGGTGLGLSIVNELTKMMNGDINLTSTEGKGSEFNISLILEKATKTSQELDSSKTSSHYQTHKGDISADLLVVEDNPVNQLLATRVLEKMNFKVEIAENGVVALSKISTKKFDLILMDIQMPEKDGFQTTKEIRQGNTINSTTPIIAMTAHVLQGEKQKCLDYGMNDYISKPFSPKDLKQRIIELFNN